MSRPPVPDAVRAMLDKGYTSQGLQSFSDIAHSLRWARWRPFDPQRGTLLDTQPGEMFIGVESTDDCPVSSVLFNPARSLVCRPAFLAPGGERLQAGHLSLAVIPWRGTGWALVTLSDITYIGAEKVAFVPTAEVIAAVEGAPR